MSVSLYCLELAGDNALEIFTSQNDDDVLRASPHLRITDPDLPLHAPTSQEHTMNERKMTKESMNNLITSVASERYRRYLSHHGPNHLHITGSVGVSCLVGSRSLVMRQRRRIMFLVLIHMQRIFDLISEALAIGRMRVSAVLLLVDVASSSALAYCQFNHLGMLAVREHTPVWNSSCPSRVLISGTKSVGLWPTPSV